MKKLTANMKLYLKLRYRLLVLSGFCPRCRKPKNKDGFVLCKNCRQKPHKKIDLAKGRIYSKHQYQNRINKGLCTKCGKNQHVKNKKLCEKCLERAAAYYKLKKKERLIQ